MNERENRFLKLLGITPGPWDQMGSSVFYSHTEIHSISILTSLHTEIPERYNNPKLAAKAPELFLRLFAQQYIMRYSNNFNYPNPVMDVLESATGKSWGDLCQIWEGTE